MALTKIDIIESVIDKLGITKKNTARIVETVFEIMKEQLAGGNTVKISGYGSFLVKDKKARRGRNPQTGDEMEISARKVLIFKSSPVLRKALNRADSLVR
jgi:integration host factor subunit alpha